MARPESLSPQANEGRGCRQACHARTRATKLQQAREFFTRALGNKRPLPRPADTEERLGKEGETEKIRKAFAGKTLRHTLSQPMTRVQSTAKTPCLKTLNLTSMP